MRKLKRELYDSMKNKFNPKILIVSCNGMGTGGTQRVIMQIVRGLSKEYQFDLLEFTMDKGHYEKEFIQYGGGIFRIPFYSGKSSMIKRIDYYLRGIYILRRVRNILKQNGPYVAIHCNNYLESAFCLFAAKIQKIPVRICHAHGYFGEMNTRARKIYLKICRKIILKNANKIVGCSQNAINMLFGADIGTVIPNAVDTRNFSVDKYSKTKLNNLKMIQVGQYCENKNQLFSIEVLYRLVKKEPSATLTLVGFGSYKANIDNKVIEYGLSSNVNFVDGNSDIAEALSRNNVFLFPSKKEGLGIAPIEAQNMRLMCFVSDTVPKEIDIGMCRFLPLSLGPKVWSDEILQYFRTEKDVEFTIDGERYNPESIIQQYHNLYESENEVKYDN